MGVAVSGRPILGRTRKGIQINLAVNSMHHARAGILPEGPVMPIEGILRVPRNGAQPELMRAHATSRSGERNLPWWIKGRRSAMLADEFWPESSGSLGPHHLGDGRTGQLRDIVHSISKAPAAWPRGWWHMLDEPLGLFRATAAKVIEMIGPLDARGGSTRPVRLKRRIGDIANGRLDLGKADA